MVPVPNRLARSTSPYLGQHADNPVDWWEWTDEAFASARERDVPILLSVGYAACHWCHVMAHESFEDAAIAEQLNAGFVAIKVDREERPDIDAVYMDATTALTGHGGWPMTCLLDHDGAPFYAGTYFPPAQFRELLTAAGDAWRGQRAEITAAGQRIVEGLARASFPRSAATAPPDAGALDRAAEALVGQFDEKHARVRRGAEVPAVDGAGVPAAPARAHRRSRVAGHGPPGRWRRWPAAASTTSSAAASPATPSTARGSCRTSRRCSTTMRCCCAPTCTGGG